MSNKALQDDIQALLRRGEYLAAYDLASNLVIEHPQDPSFQYLAVLTLARSGAIKRAMKLYEEYQLNRLDNEDYSALEARLLKDRAMNSEGDERGWLIIAAADCYAAVYERTKGYYPAVNAATLYYLAGKKEKATLFASDAYQLCIDEAVGEGLGEYYRLATIAETCLLLDRGDEAHQTLKKAAKYIKGDFSALATTRRQLSLLIPEQEVSQFLSPISAPSVIHFAGHMISNNDEQGRFRPNAEECVRKSIVEQISSDDIGFGYGSLASGADILFAEALLASKASLHIVLPFNIDEFIEVSVRPAGENWVERFNYCIEHAAVVTYSTEDSFLGDTSLFHYASRLAMGLAIEKSRYLQTSIKQITVWDGELTESVAGTAADIRLWQSQKYPSTSINSKTGEMFNNAIPSKPNKETESTTNSGRHTCAMIFGDIKGFSKLCDKQIPAFVNDILGGIGETLARYDDKVLMRNTWGDGVFIVFRDAVTAAECALALQETMSGIDLAEAGLPEHIALRLSVHFGPVYQMKDPVLNSTNYFGSHVSKAARIEPVTPEGEVYTTRQFVAELALIGDTIYSGEYVGIMPAAKKYGEMPMYLLKKRYSQ